MKIIFVVLMLVCANISAAVLHTTTTSGKKDLWLSVNTNNPSVNVVLGCIPNVAYLKVTAGGWSTNPEVIYRIGSYQPVFTQVVRDSQYMVYNVVAFEISHQQLVGGDQLMVQLETAYNVEQFTTVNMQGDKVKQLRKKCNVR